MNRILGARGSVGLSILLAIAASVVGGSAMAANPQVRTPARLAASAVTGTQRSPCAYTPLQIEPEDVPTEVEPYTAFSVIVWISTIGGEATSLCTASFGAMSGDGSITYDEQDVQFFNLGANQAYEYTVYLHSGAAGGCNTLHIRGHDSADYYPEICVVSESAGSELGGAAGPVR